MIREEVGVDRGVIVTNSSDDQHTSDVNSGGKDDGDDGDEARGWDSGVGGWNTGAISWDIHAGGWDTGAIGWDANEGNFDQNRGRQHEGTSQIDEVF